MSDEQTTPAEAPAGAAAYTDEQLAAEFPGQDIAHVRAMLDKSAGVHAPADSNADGGAPDGTNKDQQQDSEEGAADAGGEADPGEDQDYPEWIPEKFRKGTVEEAMQKLADSYGKLERARGGEESDSDPAAADSDDADPDTNTQPAKFDLRSLEAEFVEKGKVTQEMIAEAAKHGMDEGDLTRYLEGQKAIANQLITEVHNSVGGEAEYTAMMQWMVGNMSEADVAAYDAAMGTGNKAQISMAVRATKAAYDAAVGKDASRTVDGETGKQVQQGFQSKQEMIEAMRDPRYAKDPAYRKEVERKIHTGSVW
jgi:hypothetical protein